MAGLASRAQHRMSFLRYVLVSVPAVLLLGTLSGQLSGAGHGNPWFDALAKPALMPPGWAFGLVWTLLYILLGLSLAMLLHAHGAHRRGRVIALFAIALALNFAWPPVFFALHETGAALALVAAMIVVTGTVAGLAWPIRRAAALLLFPYLAWLAFAAALTAEIARLNPDADAVAPAAPSTDIPL